MSDYELDEQLQPRQQAIFVTPIYEAMRNRRLQREQMFQRNVIAKTILEPVHRIPAQILPAEFYREENDKGSM
jgi:hypothetical protein